MMLVDIFQETYSALTVNKVRTSLTMLGIVIGIGSVIAMVSIGEGSQGTIQANIQSIGSNLVMIQPGAPRGVGQQVSAGRGNAQTLLLSDANAIQSTVSSINAVAPEVSKRFQITAKGYNTNTTVLGTVAAYPTVRNISMDEGTFLSDGNVTSMSKVAVLGPTARDDLFGVGATNALGGVIRISGQEFKVIGITTLKGGSGFSNQDDMVFIPISTMQRYLTGTDYVTTISVQAQDQTSMASVQDQINTLLLQRHKISNVAQADFSIMNQEDIIATATSVTNTFTLLLGAIAGISLLVGGIGIMNMMLTTVTERTREIGLRKAIGAQKNDITLQFLMESIVLTALGGILGILFGWIVSMLVSKFGGIATTISFMTIVLAVGVSATIGIVFGYYPATRAAKLNPIEALRYE
jgi:putative ABC transport system permease protein